MVEIFTFNVWRNRVKYSCNPSHNFKLMPKMLRCFFKSSQFRLQRVVRVHGVVTRPPIGSRVRVGCPASERTKRHPPVIQVSAAMVSNPLRPRWSQDTHVGRSVQSSSISHSSGEVAYSAKRADLTHVPKRSCRNRHIESAGCRTGRQSVIKSFREHGMTTLSDGRRVEELPLPVDR